MLLAAQFASQLTSRRLPPRRPELDAPLRTLQEHRTLELEEAGRRARREPIAQVGRILADQRGEDAGQPLEVHLYEVARGGVRDIADEVPVLALRPELGGDPVQLRGERED